MTVLAAVRVIAVLCSGLFGGLLFGDRMGPAFARPTLSPSSFVQFQQIIHIHYIKLLPALTLTAFVRSRGAIVFLSYQLEGVEVVGDQGRIVAKTSFRMDLPQVSRFGPWTQPATTRWVRVGGIWYLKASQQDADTPLKTDEGLLPAASKDFT